MFYGGLPSDLFSALCVGETPMALSGAMDLETTCLLSLCHHQLAPAVPLPLLVPGAQHHGCEDF